jgi:hypothetical protein
MLHRYGVISILAAAACAFQPAASMCYLRRLVHRALPPLRAPIEYGTRELDQSAHSTGSTSRGVRAASALSQRHAVITAGWRLRAACAASR